MESLDEDQRYDRQASLAGTLYTCEPLGFGNLVNPEEMNALSIYYFVDREVDVGDIYAYIRSLRASNFRLVKCAQRTLKKVAKAYDFPVEEINRIL